jgi:hypothetical protein
MSRFVRSRRWFEYEFARVPPGREALGSTHGSELSYVFGTLDRRIVCVGPPAQANAADMQISEVIQQYWTNFAKTGNPNGGQLPAWSIPRSRDRGSWHGFPYNPTPKEQLCVCGGNHLESELCGMFPQTDFSAPLSLLIALMEYAFVVRLLDAQEMGHKADSPGTLHKLDEFKLPAGTHDVELRSSSGLTLYHQVINVLPGKTTKLKV